MIDPAAQAVLDRLASGPALSDTPDDAAWALTWRERYRSATALGGAPGPVYAVEDIAGPIPLRVYRPSPGAGTAVLFIHGGGMIGGNLDSHDASLRHLAVASGRVVVSVGYRLAPEHPFPAAPEDCYASLLYAASLDLGPVAVMGDSTGGLLAVTTAMLARDRGGPALERILALYPNADLREDRSYPSMAAYDGNVVALDELHRGLRTYLPGVDRTQPLVSPLLAPDLSALPPATVITCELDPLRDEGEALAGRLGAEPRRLPGMIHGLFQFAGAIPRGAALIEEIGRSLA